MSYAITAKLALSAATFAIDRPYDYIVPPALVETILPGMRVLVPFGQGNKVSEGLVLAVETLEEEPEVRLKNVLALLDETPVLREGEVKLCVWMARRYFCTVYQAAKTMLPTGLWFSVRDTIRISDGITREQAIQAAGKSKHAERVVELLLPHPNGLELKDVRLAFGVSDPMPAVRKLVGEGILTMEASVKRGVGDKTEEVVSLALPSEDALAQVSLRRKTAPLQYSVVELLAAVGQGGMKEVCYLTGASPTTVRTLAKKGLVTLTKREVLRSAIHTLPPPAKEFTLNDDQQRAFDALNGWAQEEKPGVALLYGVTGSGKTQVYIRLIQSVLERGKSALVLVPEIALTPQLLRIFTGYFGEQVAVLHSSLPDAQRYDEWKRARSGKARVVVGARSAVFAPLENLGVVVLDEEHETSYKSENVPRYHAREVHSTVVRSKTHCWC